MAAPKRTRLQVARDRAEIAQHYCRRLSQFDIAAALNAPGSGREYVVSHDMVQDDLEAIQKQWRTETARSLDEDKARELAKIDELERTYWRAWEASLEDKQRTVTKQGKGVQGDKVEAQVQKEGQTGNPAYLAGVQWCIERRAKLLGLDSPAKVDVTSDGKGIASLADLFLLTRGQPAAGDGSPDDPSGGPAAL